MSKYNAQLGKLDLLLTYLWRVHAVDYYGGHELYGPNSESAWRNGARLLRGARPESGALVNAAQGAHPVRGWALSSQLISLSLFLIGAWP